MGPHLHLPRLLLRAGRPAAAVLVTAMASAAQDLPRAFVANAGQWPAEVSHHRAAGPLGLWVTPGELVLDLHGGKAEAERSRRGVALGLVLEGASPSEPLGEGRSCGVRDYRRGPDPSGWALGASTHERVRLAGAWPGVDLVLREGRSGEVRFAYDLELAPGADLDRVVFSVRGASGLALDPDGRLVIETALGPLVQEAPVSWTVDPDGVREPHEVRFRLLGALRYGFVTEPVEPGVGLVVDPGVVWSTFLGDDDEDRVHAIARHPTGLLLTGSTRSSLFPRVRGSYDIDKAPGLDAFVTWMSSDIGWVVRSTFLGGVGDDLGEGVAVGPGGEVWVAGTTGSADLPVTAGAHDTAHGGGRDGFLARFSAAGDQLLACSFLGGSGDDLVQDLELDGQGRPVVCGRTGSSAFPIVGGWDPTFGGGVASGGDAFVARLDPGLAQVECSTFLGGSANDGANALACAADGGVLVAGWTGSVSFPVTAGVLDAQLAGTGTLQDGFISRLDADLSQLTWSTFLGGGARDEVHDLALEASGEAWLVGTTSSADLPLGPAPHQPGPGGLDDGFFGRLSADGTALAAGSYLGGSDRDELRAVALSGSGGALLAGGSASTDLVLTAGAYDTAQNSWPGSSSRDALVVRVGSTGAVEYASFVGGFDDEVALDIVSDGGSGVFLAGWTTSFNYPTPGGFDSFYDLSLLPDGFLTRLDLLEFPFRYGDAKVNSVGGLAEVSFVGFPSLTTDDFIVLGDGALPNTTVMIFWSNSPAQTPFLGGQLLLGPPLHRTAMQQVGWFGSAELPVTVEPSMVGTRRYYQYWYLDPADPFGAGLSNALEVLFHP